MLDAPVAAEAVMVRGGVPMMLMGTGKSVRRSLALILQNAGKPRSTVATNLHGPARRSNSDRSRLAEQRRSRSGAADG